MAHTALTESFSLLSSPLLTEKRRPRRKGRENCPRWALQIAVDFSQGRFVGHRELGSQMADDRGWEMPTASLGPDNHARSAAKAAPGAQKRTRWVPPRPRPNPRDCALVPAQTQSSRHPCRSTDNQTLSWLIVQRWHTSTEASWKTVKCSFLILLAC